MARGTGHFPAFDFKVAFSNQIVRNHDKTVTFVTGQRNLRFLAFRCNVKGGWVKLS